MAQHLLLLLDVIEKETNIDVRFAISDAEQQNLSVYKHVGNGDSNEPLKYGRFTIHLLFDLVKAFKGFFCHLLDAAPRPRFWMGF